MARVELERPLDVIETSLASRIPFTFISQGSLELGALNEAVNALCWRNPVLRANIEKDDENCRLVCTTASLAIKTISGDKSSWHTEASEINDKSNSSTFSPLLIRENHLNYLVLNFSHVIVDAHAAFAYMAEFWDFYTNIVKRKEVEHAQSTRLPMSPTQMLDLIRKRDSHLRKGNCSKESNDARKNRGPSTLGSTWKELIQASPAETGQFMKRAKDAGTTVGALIAGTMAKVLRSHEPGVRSAPIHFWTAVDIRKLVEPPIRPTEVTNLISVRNFTIFVDARMSPAAIARRFKFELGNEIRSSDEDLLTGLFIEEISEKMSFDHLPGPRIMLNNWGELPKFNHPEELSLIDFTLPGMSGKQKIDLNMPWSCHLTSYTFAGSLRIHFLGQRPQIVQEFRNIMFD